MPGWLAALSRFNPLTLTADAWRGALLFGESPSWRALLPLAALAALLFALALSQMRRAAQDR
jgi:ABC-type polysaccharide/polyol phosphate export permease